MSRTTAAGTAATPTRRFGRVRDVLDLPVTSYYLVLFSVLALTAFGLVMVLSASSISSYDGGTGSSFSLFFRQATFAIAGLGLMFVASVMPLKFWKRVALPAVILGIGLQILPLLPGFGHTVNGSQSWVRIGGFQFQPAEFVKLAIALYIGAFMANRAKSLNSWKALFPLLAVIATVLGLVLVGGDLGTGLIVIAVIAGALFVGGLPWSKLLSLGLIAVTGVFLMVVTSANRMARIKAMLAGGASTDADALGQHWQSNHGLFALASGGWFGVGLGASREKWNWLPEAHNDFIFAIIGEELGLLGSSVVIGLFVALALGLVRVVVRSKDTVVQATTAGIFMWMIGQAAVNIGVVTGLLPVIGVPLPFVSYGGSALLANFLAIGVVLSFAREEPGARAAMAAHRARLSSSLSVFASRKRRGK